MDKLKVDAVRGSDLRNGNTMTFTGVVSAAILEGLCNIPQRDATRRTGYQRRPNSTRVSQLANEIREGKVDLPTAILLSVREPVPKGFISGSSDLVKMDFSTLSPNSMFVVDGQHRILAIQKALSEMDSSPNIKIPFVCLVGADEAEELKQFYVVNKNAKSVATDLAYNLISERAKSEPGLYDDLVRKNQAWQVVANDIVEELARREIWKDLIQMPNEPKGKTLVPSASFVRSLKAMILQPNPFQRMSMQHRVQLLEAYWSAVNLWFDNELTDNAEGRHNFGLFKGVGVTVLHGLLPHIMELIRSDGDSLFLTSSYHLRIGSVLAEIEGSDSENNSVKGIDFWRSGYDGGIASFTSGAGQRILSERLKELLPEVPYE